MANPNSSFIESPNEFVDLAFKDNDYMKASLLRFVRDGVALYLVQIKKISQKEFTARAVEEVFSEWMTKICHEVLKNVTPGLPFLVDMNSVRTNLWRAAAELVADELGVEEPPCSNKIAERN